MQAESPGAFDTSTKKNSENAEVQPMT